MTLKKILYILFFVPFIVFGQVEFTSKTNFKSILEGEVFSLQYTLSMENNSEDIGFVEDVIFSDDFKVVEGPSKSKSIRIINGKRSISLSYQYYLLALNTGEFTLPAQKVKVGGEILESEKAIITVNNSGKATPRKEKKKKKKAKEVRKMKSYSI